MARQHGDVDAAEKDDEEAEKEAAHYSPRRDGAGNGREFGIFPAPALDGLVNAFRPAERAQQELSRHGPPYGQRDGAGGTAPGTEGQERVLEFVHQNEGIPVQEGQQGDQDARHAELVLLTKADKLASGARKAQLNMVREAVLAFNGDVQVETFSSLKKQGVDKLRQKLDTWFNEMQPVEETQDGE